MVLRLIKRPIPECDQANGMLRSAMFDLDEVSHDDEAAMSVLDFPFRNRKWAQHTTCLKSAIPSYDPDDF